MKHLLVDALSVNNLSGRHVLMGHLEQMAASSREFRFTLLSSAANDARLGELPAGVARYRAPVGAGWLQRLAWQRRAGGALCRDLGVDAVFSPSGMLSEGLPRPQVVLAQNPWPLVGTATGLSALKLALQRRAFARAQSRAAIMAFNSAYMRDLYRTRFNAARGACVVAHQGIDGPMFPAGAGFVAVQRREPLVLCVSVMARHKAVEVLVEAFASVVGQLPSARLSLVGGWPDAAYRREIEQQIASLGCSTQVTMEGHVDAAALRDLYARARVFCLPSRCESFGIPAVEAQAFGTPAVVADGTAAPEIIGAGGQVVPQDDPAATAAALLALLRDETAWAGLSHAARANAERFQWPACSAPLVAAIDSLAASLA